MMKKNDGNVNELYAFHRLTVESEKFEEIFENNLDKEHMVKDNSENTLGNGVYFMIDPSKNEAMKNSKGGTLILAKILAGYWTKKCDSGCNLAPFRLTSTRYDSTIDQSENNICIFDKNQIMPLYLIFYQ